MTKLEGDALVADKAAPSIDGRDGEEHGGSACDEAGSKQQASYFVTHPPQ